MSAQDLDTLLRGQPLLALTIVAILLAIAAQMIAARRPALAGLLRNTAYLGLAAAGILTVVGFALGNRHSDAALWFDRTRPATIEGGETVIALRPDGHFWVRAELNGEPVDFLIDTGATYTSLSREVAERAGVTMSQDNEGRLLDTANGTVVARMGTARTLRFGGILAQDLPLAVLPDASGDTAVIGMNLLSRLKRWRVEDDRLILTPGAPVSNRQGAQE
ncbi:TIGR02281 family clan AA aspartic protease [Novosphingobium sp. 1949]|uniref:TIGR02281 family clan AA aspartic protease n=1 Tax=Novosphingobium organovorum TaxID=2930092 RepID=A0ABT0B8H4_9SPHN|nr:TIGR02281 family clan AA aspartic protease [Novosphingobium organovorum]MCJ2181224.1 TIGR02281 family clan AA aspartic protease [Novosphingobium organovorum]